MNPAGWTTVHPEASAESVAESFAVGHVSVVPPQENEENAPIDPVSGPPEQLTMIRRGYGVATPMTATGGPEETQ
ncbi:MAG TPA: hypothetical protein VMH39_13950 [Gemmatimonadaceae bacterium]|nr:hypothetical protein [Gemmatimonadaceae bacterium]